MTIKEIENIHRRIVDMMLDRKVKSGLDYLYKLVQEAQVGDYRIKYDAIVETYKNILKYHIGGVNDPERPRVFRKMVIDSLALADKLKQTILTRQSGMEIYRMKHNFEKRMGAIKEEAMEAVSDLSFDKELSAIISDTFLKKDDKASHEKKSEVFTHLFNLIWLTDEFVEADVKLVNNVRKSDAIQWYEKCVVVSALTLSLIRCFDKQKIDLLFEFYEDNEEQVWHRALVGLILGLYVHDERLNLYPDLISRLKLLKDIAGLPLQVEQVVIQLLRSKDTERITRKLQEEIIPDMIKLKPKLEEKLDLDALMSDEFMEDKNPDWEDFFKDSPDLYEKMEEFTNMQMEGADVFWSAFAMLKQFDFFKNIPNWFMPFHGDNYDIREIFENEKENFDPEVFLEGISKSAFLCNSDKYSFCLNIKYIPASQKALLMDFFNAELKNMNDALKDDELLNKAAVNKFIFTQYIQDLYRFFKLHPLKKEFDDIFSQNLDVYNTSYFGILIEEDNILKNISEFFFESDDYENAIKVYQVRNDNGDNSFEIFEKMGYCYQKLGNYKKALDHYLKAELFDKNRSWVLKKIGLCYKRLGDIDNAISYFSDALKIEPENLFVLSSLGHCYLDKCNYKEAENHFYKMEFISAGDEKVLRPLVWISFVTGKLDTAKKHLAELMNKKPNHYDYMNQGHIEWCSGKRNEAIENYKLSIRQPGNTLQKFMEGFHEDKAVLMQNGIKEDDIALMLDQLRYSLEEM